MVSHSQPTAQRIDELEKETKRIFHYRGEIQKHLDDIEDGIWRGRKVAAWNTWILPCTTADEDTLKDLRITYKIWLSKYLELSREAEELYNYFSKTQPCNQKQSRLGSILYQLELGSNRLVDFCTTARTGIPYCSWVNRHAIKCLDLMSHAEDPNCYPIKTC